MHIKILYIILSLLLAGTGYLGYLNYNYYQESIREPAYKVVVHKPTGDMIVVKDGEVIGYFAAACIPHPMI